MFYGMPGDEARECIVHCCKPVIKELMAFQVCLEVGLFEIGLTSVGESA